MNNNSKKCFSKEHENIDAISFCFQCKIYMCNKCENLHSKLFKEHQSYKSDIDLNEIFTGFCKYENHKIELEYFCKTHNELCCAACIAKIKKKGKGQHTDCDICLLEDIKNEKKNILSENINNLESLSNNIKELINHLKLILEKINKDKEEIKLRIQNIFTKIRNSINEREDELLLEVDNIYNNIYFDENIIKDSEKLPNKIKKSIEIGKTIGEKWNEQKELSLLINDCIIIEQNINEINKINETITKCKNIENIKIKFYPEEQGKEIDNILEKIKKIGNISKELKHFMNSEILNLEEEQLLIEWLPEKPKNINLILNSSKDGDNLKIFEDKCKDKSPTLIVITSEDGFKFGGYTTKQWKSNVINKDNNAFVFSLDKRKKYKILKPQIATYLSNNYWLFGYSENAIVIYDKCTNKKNHVGNGTYDIKERGELNGGNEKFTVKNFEVYHLEY